MEQQHGPWKIKKREVKYKNPWIEVFEDQVIQPDGKSGIFGTVSMKDGVSVLALDQEGFVYLIEEFHYAVGRNCIETISGAIDQGESPLDAAKRELKEEIGAEAREWIDLGRVDPFTSAVHSMAYLWIARNFTFSRAKPESTEVIKVVRLPFEEVLQMVMESKITHGPSCVLILKAKAYLGK